MKKNPFKIAQNALLTGALTLAPATLAESAETPNTKPYHPIQYMLSTTFQTMDFLSESTDALKQKEPRQVIAGLNRSLKNFVSKLTLIAEHGPDAPYVAENL